MEYIIILALLSILAVIKKAYLGRPEHIIKVNHRQQNVNNVTKKTPNYLAGS